MICCDVLERACFHLHYVSILLDIPLLRPRDVHMYRDIFENGDFFLHFILPSACSRRPQVPKTKVFLNDPESGDFWKRRASRCMWTDENGRFLSKIMLVGSRRRYTWKLRSKVQPLTIQCAKITSTCMIITIFQDDYHLKFSISDLFCEKTTPNCAQKFGFCPFLCFLFKFSKKILCLWPEK